MTWHILYAYLTTRPIGISPDTGSFPFNNRVENRGLIHSLFTVVHVSLGRTTIGPLDVRAETLTTYDQGSYERTSRECHDVRAGKRHQTSCPIRFSQYY